LELIQRLLHNQPRRQSTSLSKVEKNRTGNQRSLSSAFGARIRYRPRHPNSIANPNESSL